jgi:PPOX class probable F420-dependent enzyme
MPIDFTSTVGTRALRHLESDPLVWLTTVGRSGQPNPNPVWFVWRAGRVLVMTQPNTVRLIALQANPRVALNFETGSDGNDVVVVNALATVRPDHDPLDAADRAAYLAKYQAGIASLGYSADQMLDTYSVPLELHPVKLRGL